MGSTLPDSIYAAHPGRDPCFMRDLEPFPRVVLDLGTAFLAGRDVSVVFVTVSSCALRDERADMSDRGRFGTRVEPSLLEPFG